MQWKAQWITTEQSFGDVCPLFGRRFSLPEDVKKATLFISAMGVYNAWLNDQLVGDFVLAPAWTSYHSRLQYQEYDVTHLLQQENILTVDVGKGWYRSPLMGDMHEEGRAAKAAMPAGLIAELHLEYTSGNREIIPTDTQWKVGESQVRFSEIYDGEIYDATVVSVIDQPVALLEDGPTNTLIPQEGEKIIEEERLAPAAIFTTPKGETVIDFGQNLTGYVELTVTAKAGDRIRISHAEVMDQQGNFYTENYRRAKSLLEYTCKDGAQTYKPQHTFFGFRYLRLDEFPGTPSAEQFTAIAVNSDMKRTGYITSSNPLLNQLFSNVIWGQKGNFLDVPTDCPQRDERLGWTGDAQVFVKAASYNFDVERFFKKWLKDLAADQGEDGFVGFVIPDVLTRHLNGSSAWGDAATICPWQIYQTYGDDTILADQFDSMCGWVDYITSITEDEFLWTGGEHFGDWLGLDAPSGSYTGSSRKDFIATAFYAQSTALVIKAGKVLGKDIAAYQALYNNILATFRKAFPVYNTQTEMALAIQFMLAEDLQATADQLAAQVKEDGKQIRTGFVGTPYILHVLSDYGHTDLAYSLLLREDYPSWIYPVTKGATTIWEHWDGIMENGDFWSADMNSFNHYAYGAVADWIYEKAAGIQTVENAPGFEKIIIAPLADSRLEWLEAAIETRRGLVRSKWVHTPAGVRYEITTPSPTTILIDGAKHTVAPGSYVFYSK